MLLLSVAVCHHLLPSSLCYSTFTHLHQSQLANWDHENRLRFFLPPTWHITTPPVDSSLLCVSHPFSPPLLLASSILLQHALRESNFSETGQHPAAVPSPAGGSPPSKDSPSEKWCLIYVTPRIVNMPIKDCRQTNIPSTSQEY